MASWARKVSRAFEKRAPDAVWLAIELATSMDLTQNMNVPVAMYFRPHNVLVFFTQAFVKEIIN